jgi:hypothetical protein
LKEEDQLAANVDFTNKHGIEVEKTDTLLKEKLTMDEEKRLGGIEKVKLAALIEDQSQKLNALKAEIEEKQKIVDEKSKRVGQMRTDNTKETEKSNRNKKNYAALTAKLEFIESKYDYSSQAKGLRIEDFKDLQLSNVSVNNAIDGFATKLQVTQKEI